MCRESKPRAFDRPVRARMAFVWGFILLLMSPGAFAAGHVFPDCISGPLSSNNVCNATLSIGERVQALVSALETKEKFKLLGSSSPGAERLGLPSYEWWQEALHGVAHSPGVKFAESGDFSYATSFPQPILLGASFDDDLVEAVATVVSTEARAFNNFNRSGLDYWTPNINPYRDPRWGRGQETPGEDPYHLSSYVRAVVKGLQGGEDPDVLKVVATCKHFVAYDIEDWHGNERYEFDARVTPQELAEYYMPPFEACARANVGSIMCSYNSLNGVPACSSSYILQDILRDHWNWTREYQYVVSDCDSIQNVYLPHKYRQTRSASAASSLLAGTDLDCGEYYGLHLPSAYEEGLIDDDALDTAISRIYAGLMKLGYFDPGEFNPYRSLEFSDVFTPDAEELARKAAERSIVLIKNDGTLPIQVPVSSNLTIALIGSWANATTDMQGNYYGTAKYLHSPYFAASQIPNVNAIYGGIPGDPTTNGYPQALEAAAAADVVIYADGPTLKTEAEEKDRTLIRWSGERIDIVTHLASLGKPFVILQMGGQLDDAPFLDNANVSAIVWGGYPGQAGGDALMNILTGRAAPAGRLPVTQYPARYVDDVPMTDMGLRPDARTGNPGRTYMWYDQATVPFGWGLHYTTFDASIARGGDDDDERWDVADLAGACSEEETRKELCPFQTVDVQVSNTGNATSDFVVLGFLSGAHGPEPYPIKRLVAYRRLHDVAAGEQQVASLALTLGSLGRRDEDGNLVLYPGEYSLLVDVPTQATWNFTLVGEPFVLDEWPQDPGVAQQDAGVFLQATR
ncbi:glycoside hydrolase family 3 protein [Durotheca rogersii]|uniref:glycoside hydrolase family 3 protein n=1 Tax=Durotheca rogersii TaxID=419775 RepID=UPI00221FF09B|nr:glycoside hydrolase family 3 protein [Durotheca rogersii]KAI5866490.1 glycoside hydrolase family 3 protein [Durotheca rogersii]